MSDPLPSDPDAARRRIVALLEERAALLRPPADLVERAIERCRRVDRGSAGTPAEPQPPPPAPAPVQAVETEPDLADALAPPPPVAAEVAAAATEPDVRASGRRPAAEARPARTSGRQASPATSRRTTTPGATRPLAAGQQLGGYRVEALIGSGGMGHVYRATQLSMNRQVALKVLAPHLSRNQRLRERFLREARAAGRLQHPNLIAVHDVGEADGLYFFSMELVEGSSLKEIIAELGRVGEERALEIARQTLEALRYAHERGTVHRDIKPDNLMVMTNGRVKVADLGLSKVEEGDLDGFTTQTGTMLGTPYYMPPEQGRDAHSADHRADLYGLGATLYHMVCGKVPFEGDTPVAVLLAATTQPLAWPEPPPSPQMRHLIARLMERDPADRPAGAAQAIAMVDAAARGEAPAAPAPANVSARHARAHAKRRLFAGRGARRTLLGLSGALLGVAALAAAIALLVANAPLQRLRSTVLAKAGMGAFQGAMSDIQLARSERASDEAALARLAAIEAEVVALWDATAKADTLGPLEEARRNATPQRARQAQEILDRIPAERRSPAVLAEIARVQEEIDNARFAAGREVDAQPRAREAVGQWWSQLLGGRSEDLVGVEGGVASFRGAGKVLLRPPPSPADGRHPPPIRLAISIRGMPPVPEDSWAIHVAPGRSVVAANDGLYLVNGSQRTRLVEREGSAPLVLSLLSRRGELVLVARDSGALGWRRLPLEGTPQIEWNLAAGHSAIVEAAPMPPGGGRAFGPR